MEWSFSTKSSRSSHNLLSFKVNSDDDKSLKSSFDSLPGKEFMTMSNAQGLIEKKLSGIGGHHKSFQPPLGLNGSVASTMSPIVSPCNSVIGITELRKTSNILRVPTQMTIFYAGQVCVYDDISPEKVYP
ncbi:protein TIFY 6B-like [Impatiens glandulifera]|uniref:protein TIFY 6B-like n=1 Tax=Impatiens glandulifera TaxID=253017 RepID=UPI001FB0A744|nr:protein TIFY 6B-like [Impatiens glandulifera]